MAHVIFKNSDHALHVDGAQSENLTTGVLAYLGAGATVTVTLTTTAGVPLAGETWPVAATFIAGSNGNFRAIIRRTIIWPVSGRARAVITIDNGTDQHAELTTEIIALSTRYF